MRTAGAGAQSKGVPKARGVGAVPPTAGRLARQRRPGWMAAGAMLLAFAVLTNVYLFRSSSERVPVVRLARDVAAGHKLEWADLTIARVAVDSGVPTVPERQLEDVVGRRAAIHLRGGTLLAASQLASGRSPQQGQALVTVPLKAGEVPPGLAPGWQVRVVFTAGGQAPSAGAGAPSDQSVVPRDVEAVVDQVSAPDTQGTVSTSLLVADADSSTVARRAAAGLVVLVVTERRG
ncbi:hypothetical protein DMH08_25060 [Actinomadura sp. WAC 06369]|nr:hypothetical protein DMH08_25060 [Actinomadura sp. WAC 06369]